MRYLIISILTFILMMVMQLMQIQAQDTKLTFPKSREDIIKAFQVPKFKTRGIQVVPAPKVGAMVQFAYNSDQIRSDAYALLNIYVDVFNNKLSNLKLIIVGHTDSIGSESFNLNLSLARAHAIQNYFTVNGIDKGRLTIKGMGETQPIASNFEESGRALNRRVEFIRRTDFY